MSSAIYIRTSDPGRQVRIAYDGRATVVDHQVCHEWEFDLTCTLTRQAMRVAREAARAAGLRLRKPRQIAMRLGEVTS